MQQQLTERILFGAAYYHEYQPSPRLSEDMRLMKEAGFSVIRVGESVWSTWEPENGRFDLEWMAPILDEAHSHGIRVILGTPTYAVPMWLARLYPEINAHRRTGQATGWGARQEIDYSHPAFLFHAERVIREVVSRYADHPSVIGFQVDNEPGNEIFYNPQVFQRFVDYLRNEYGSVEKLNQEWGLTYWSHCLSTWADLWTPDANAQPQYDLAWRKFQAELTTSFIAWQSSIVREYSRSDQFVTTCISYERRTVEDEHLTRSLDVTAGNPYYRMQDKLALPSLEEPNEQHWTTSGTWALYATADRMYGSKQAPFLVTETNAQAIGFSWSNEPAYDGQWRQVAWALVSRGAAMIEYWHWHTLHAGAETYWGGILPHSQEPGRVYQQISALGADFAAAGESVTGLVPDSDVAILFSNASKWAQEEYPSLGGPSGADTRSFQTAFDTFARAAFNAGLQTRTVHPAQITAAEPRPYAQENPVLVAAAFTIATDHDLKWLESYAEAGGHLIVGIRTGYEDHEARARLERKPAFLDEAAGVYYDEFSNLAAPLPLRPGPDAGDLGLNIPESSTATLWADGLIPEGAQTLAHYDHPHFSRFPAITTKEHGRGRVTYVGTLPDVEVTGALLKWAVSMGQTSETQWRRVEPSQTVTSATNQHSERVHFVHNWTWEPTSFTLPTAARDVVNGSHHVVGEVLQLSAWDVRILIEEA